MSPFLSTQLSYYPPEGWEATLLMSRLLLNLAPKEPQRVLTFLSIIKETLTRAQKENKSKFDLSKASCYIY